MSRAGGENESRISARHAKKRGKSGGQNEIGEEGRLKSTVSRNSSLAKIVQPKQLSVRVCVFEMRVGCWQKVE